MCFCQKAKDEKAYNSTPFFPAKPQSRHSFAAISKRWHANMRAMWKGRCRIVGWEKGHFQNLLPSRHHTQHS